MFWMKDVCFDAKMKQSEKMMQNCNKTAGEKKQDTGRNSGTGFAIYKLQKGKILQRIQSREKEEEAYAADD